MFISIQKCLDRKKKALYYVECRTEAGDKSAKNWKPSDTENKNTGTSIEKFSLNEGEDVFKKSLIFLEQQENVEFKTEDLTVIRRLINQIKLHRLSLLKQPSITITSFLC